MSCLNDKMNIFLHSKYEYIMPKHMLLKNTVKVNLIIEIEKKNIFSVLLKHTVVVSL